MKKILTVIGARPQFIKCAPVSQVLRKKFKEILVHTGQHYDQNMSDVFFEQLSIPTPNYNLGIGSSTHAVQTAQMMMKIEEISLSEKPDAILVYGDTNSTLAGALVAAKLLIPLVHIEAGLRSFNKKMPEEVNRVCTDHLSKLLFCPTDVAVTNLLNENISQGVHLVGDVMKDAIFQVLENLDVSTVLQKFDIVENKKYYFFTLHRQENTDDLDRLSRILNFVSFSKYPVIFPIHPRTRKVIEQNNIRIPQNIILHPPVNYFESIALQKKSECVITDSGGMQKEAYILQKPCITLRPETEWVETVQDGVNILVDDNAEKFIEAIQKYQNNKIVGTFVRYGDGKASVKIVETLEKSI